MVPLATILIIVALILALIEEFRAQGQSLLGYSVILIAAAILWSAYG